MRTVSIVRLLALAAALLLPDTARSQGRRPSVPRDADPNDWEAYFNAGVAELGTYSQRAEEHFIWASRLRPDRPEPLYARWVAYWAQDIGKFEQYLKDDPRVLREPRVQSADSLRALALARNPFVHEGLGIILYDKLPGRFRDDQVTRAWIALAEAKLPVALRLFGGAVERDPRKNGYLRFVRASAFVNSGQRDSAAAELEALLAQLRAEDAKTLGSGYQSKALLEHAMGLLHYVGRRIPAARDAFARAVGEDASFSPAHAMLGELALAARDSTTALVEFGLATETSPGDVMYVIGLGKALQFAKRPKEAADQFRKAVAIELLYAAPYAMLGSALEDAGDAAGASAAYQEFLVRAPKADPKRAEIERKVKALTTTP